MRISNRSQGSNLFINKIYSKNIKVKLDSFCNAQLSDSRKKSAEREKLNISGERPFHSLLRDLQAHICILTHARVLF